MSEWQDMQKKPNTKLRDLFKSKKAETRKLSELSGFKFVFLEQVSQLVSVAYSAIHSSFQPTVL